IGPDPKGLPKMPACLRSEPWKRLSEAQNYSQWRHISVAPFDSDLELACIDSSGVYAFVWPCYRVLGGWCDAKTRCRISVEPTHWRRWTGCPSTNAFTSPLRIAPG